MGTVVLMGGEEFRRDCIPMDRELLGRVPHRPPRVVIVPTAAMYENPRLAADNGISYFRSLGAEASSGMILSREDAGSAEVMAALAPTRADIVYFTGGSPNELLRTLRHTPAWAAIVELYRAGGTIVGSSAGAMVLGEKMSAGTATWTDGLYLVPGVAVLPHHQPMPDLYVQDMRDSLPPGITVLGIQTATAAVRYDDGQWNVVGAGIVMVYGEGRTEQYRAGQTFEL